MLAAGGNVSNASHLDMEHAGNMLGSGLRRWNTRIGILSCFLIVAIAISQPAVRAGTLLGVAVTFGPASLKAGPGGQLDSYIVIGNTGDVIARIIIQCSGELLTWVTFDRSDFTLGKAERTRVDLTIAVPLDVSGGTHSGEILVDAYDDAASAGGLFGGISHLYNSKTYQISLSGEATTVTSSTTTTSQATSSATGTTSTSFEATGSNTSATTTVSVTGITTSVSITTSVVTTTELLAVEQSSTVRPPPTGCVIATAAYGSELAPEVVYMRYVRDGLIGSTPTGKMLVKAFNAFYYSWSPTLAGWIYGSASLQAIFQILLLPLVMIIHITALTFTAATSMVGNTETASIIAFLAAAVMTLSIYVGLPVTAAMKLRRAIKKN